MPENSRMLQDELLFQRATQAYLWALPAISIWVLDANSKPADLLFPRDASYFDMMSRFIDSE
ncbi:hypothetical protein A2G96_30285 [Cupriavidus nantongensis]|uniref:Uncharacterized protein n=2 Tax=Cupriavidus nantongensis TaxID=1796606 RepID=A0A142JVA6_9BURK|nr:hypothetical protein A2G96_30285 [Cupriavidus nantongensis]